MKNILILICSILVNTGVLSQSLEEMELDLISWEVEDTYYSKRELVDRILKLDPFSYDGIGHLCSYYTENNIDSVSILFDNLMKAYPDNIIPITRRIMFRRYETGHTDYGVSLNFELKYLYKALLIEPENRDLLCELANKYYHDFLRPNEENEFDDLDFQLELELVRPINIEEKVSTYKHAGDSALKYFNILWGYNYKRNIIYYPIKQLESLLNKDKNCDIKLIDTLYLNETCRPYHLIFNFPNNWESDSTINYFEKAQGSINSALFELEHLNKMKEPCFFDKSEDYWGMRFLWWRTFDNNIIIRLEKDDSNYILNWKIQEGRGGYGPTGILKQGSLRMNEKEWECFIHNFHNSGILNSKGKVVAMTDGAVWEFESKINNEYSQYLTNYPNDSVRLFVDYLIKISGLENECKHRY